jgi:hypothetical protein
MQEMQDERDAGESDGCEQDLAEMKILILEGEYGISNDGVPEECT